MVESEHIETKPKPIPWWQAKTRRGRIIVIATGVALISLMFLGQMAYNIHWIYYSDEGQALRTEGNIVKLTIKDRRNSGREGYVGQLKSSRVIWFRSSSIVTIEIEMQMMPNLDPDPEARPRVPTENVTYGDAHFTVDPWVEKPEVIVIDPPLE